MFIQLLHILNTPLVDICQRNYHDESTLPYWPTWSLIHCSQKKTCMRLFGHVARLSYNVPASQILRIYTKARDGKRPSQEWRRACGRPPTTWIHEICRDKGVTATEALQLVGNRPFWRTIAMAGGFGWTLCVMMMMMMMINMYIRSYGRMVTAECWECIPERRI